MAIPIRRKLTPAKLEKLAIELMEYLQKNEMFEYVYIYVNNKCYAQSRHNDKGTRHQSKYGHYYIIPDMPVREMLEYCNPETITVSFDGALYTAINYGLGTVEADLNKMFKKHNMYFEQGQPSDFALYYEF